MAKEVKVGVRLGGGPPPGYRWNVWILDTAYSEAREDLSDTQYQHLAMQVKDLAAEADPTHSVAASIKAIEDFHELRDKGGILGNLNVRVFFYLDKECSGIIILGTIIKKNDGQTLQADKIRMRRRLRNYLNGHYPLP